MISKKKFEFFFFHENVDNFDENAENVDENYNLDFETDSRVIYSLDHFQIGSFNPKIESPNTEIAHSILKEY